MRSFLRCKELFNIVTLKIMQLVSISKILGQDLGCFFFKIILIYIFFIN